VSPFSWGHGLGEDRRAAEDLNLSYWEVLAAKTENTKRAYLLAIRRFLEVNGFEGEEDAVKALRRRVRMHVSLNLSRLFVRMGWP
jgi:hypothetical protein